MNDVNSFSMLPVLHPGLPVLSAEVRCMIHNVTLLQLWGCCPALWNYCCEISPPLWQKGMPMPLFSYIARHVSCKKKCWKCQEWINCLFVCMDALKNPLGLPLGASLQFFQKKYLSLANHCHVDPFIHLFYALLKSWKEENIRIYHVFWPDCCHLV